MSRLQFNNNFSFDIQPYEKRLRLIVYDNTEEYVCRKESFSNLQKFIDTPTAHIFRGRLQLYKEGAEIRVEAKGAHVGTVSLDDFRNRLATLKVHRSGGRINFE